MKHLQLQYIMANYGRTNCHRPYPTFPHFWLSSPVMEPQQQPQKHDISPYCSYLHKLVSFKQFSIILPSIRAALAQLV
jgi:hypothetical protein